MKKIGIITHYYNSQNYGGNLQSYALCFYIKKYHEIVVEQISFDFKGYVENYYSEEIYSKTPIKLLIKKYGFIKCLYIYVHKELNYIKRIIFKKKYEKIDYNRYISYLTFNKEIIPHSAQIYTPNSIKDYKNEYTHLIAGSDQVWNVLLRYHSAFFLDFSKYGEKLISYAASISMDLLEKTEQELFKKKLSKFHAISVREENAVNMLKPLLSQEIKLVVDPTLLLSKNDWEEICSPRIIENDYIFCYFLGDNKKVRQLVKKYAKELGLKIVSIITSGNMFYIENGKFGDIRLEIVTPQDFISLIKHAEYVFTDSFHGTVFSYIYQKQFFVFNRTKNGEMNSRIFNIVELFNCEERFIYKKENLNIEYLESLKPIEYSYNEKLEKLIESSKEFLRVNLEVEDE